MYLNKDEALYDKNGRENYLVKCVVEYMRDLDLNPADPVTSVPVKVYREFVERKRHCDGVQYSLPKDDKSVQHYITVGKLWFRLEEFVKNGEFAEDAFYVLKNTGLKFHEQGDNLWRLKDALFLRILKECVDECKDILVNTCNRDVVNKYIKSKIEKFPKEDFRIPRRAWKHDVLEERAIQFLVGQECIVYDKEVGISKSGKKFIDALGWKKGGIVIGIECKVDMGDFYPEKRRKIKEEYLKYCDELYVLTSDEKVYNYALKWRNTLECRNIGVILWNDEVKKIEKPKKTRKNVSKEKMSIVQNMVINKYKKALDSIEKEKYITPEQMIKKIDEDLFLVPDLRK